MYTAKKIFFIIVILFFTGVFLGAKDFHGITTNEETVLPENFNFTINAYCTTHNNFLQVAANEEGYFAVYSRHTDTRNSSDLVYKQVYIDLYDSTGVFLKELSFFTTQDLAIELTSSTLNIYFYDFIVAYDFYTDSVTAFSIPSESAITSGLTQLLRKEKFQCGEWEYSCTKGFHGYTKLSRSNEVETQLLVSYNITGMESRYYIIFPALLFALIFAILKLKGISRKKSQ